jgi:hypothetical protein
VRAAARSVGAVVAPEVVAAAAVVAACSYCDAASTTAARSWEATAAAWMVAMATAKSDGATSEVADATVMVSGLVGSGVTMMKAKVEVDLNRCGPKWRS